MKKQMLLFTLSVMLLVPTVAAAEADQSSQSTKDNSICAISSVKSEKVVRELHLDNWYPNAGLAAKYGSGATDIADFKDQFGIVNQNTVNAKIVVRGDSKKEVRVGYTGVNLAGSKNITDDITYNGVVYHTGSNVASSFNINYFTVDMKRNVTEKGRTNLGMLYGVKLLSVNTALTGNATVNGVPVASRHEEKRLNAPVPTIGFIATQQVGDKGRLTGEVSGLPLGRYGHIYDAQVSYQHQVSKTTEANVGYRLFEIRGNDSEDYAKIRLSGPYVGLKMLF